MILRATAVVCLLLSLSACRHGRCYRDSDCHKDLVCRDPDVALAAAPAKRCGEGEVRCVAGCTARCTEESCAAGKVCGEAGCCEPRLCKLNNDCPRDESCVDGKCTSPGRCAEPQS